MNAYSITETFQNQSPYLPQSIYSYLEKNYQKNELYQDPIISVFYFFKILIEYPEKEDSLSILKDFINTVIKFTDFDIKLYNTLSINAKSYKAGQKVEILQEISSFNASLKIKIIESLFPIDSLTLESTKFIFNGLKSSIDNVGTMNYVSKAELIPQSFYHSNIFKTADIELFDQFLNEFHSDSDRNIIFKIEDENPLNNDYFKDFSIQDSEKISKFIDKLSSVKEFNSNSKSFFNCLKSKLLPISSELFISNLLKFKETACKQIYGYSKVLDETLCDFFSEKNNFKSNITSFIKFINFGALTITHLIEKVLISNDLEFIELLLNSICNNNFKNNNGDNKTFILPILLETSNPELIKLIISNSDWHQLFSFISLIDTIINDSIVCNNVNNQTKTNGIFQLGTVTILSYQATNIALLKKKSINILQLLLKYKDLFYWDSQLFPELPDLPIINYKEEIKLKQVQFISRITRRKIKNQSLLINNSFDDINAFGHSNSNIDNGSIINKNLNPYKSNFINKFKTNEAQTIIDLFLNNNNNNNDFFKEKSNDNIFQDSIYHSIKNRRIDIFEKLITLGKFREDYHAELIYTDFLKTIIKNDDGILDTEFLETMLEELLLYAIDGCCFHLFHWLLSTDNPCKAYLKFLPLNKNYILEKLPFSSFPVFKDYMINKITNQQI
ncbi:hypothetical protein ACTFIY_008240 [Dictyostelium cf. discoideum]